jgi:Ser/Thr protein kinase RdoA (MazF antagonist)
LAVFEPIANAEVAKLLERELGTSPWDVELVAQNSNYVYRCSGPSGQVAVRAPRVDERTSYPFWQQMQRVFGLSFPMSAAQFATVTSAVNGAGLSAPRLVAAVDWEGRAVFVTTWMSGDSWEPDQFPALPEVHRMLGRFLATMHERTYRGYGSVGAPLRSPGSYYKAAIASVRRELEAHQRPEGGRLLATMTACDPAAVATCFALVMPDIAANQFLFTESGIAGVVDLDAYVVGPVELELTIAEWCLTDHRSFADGYSSVRSFPRFAEFRAFHRALMLVNEPTIDGDVDSRFSENAFFD